MGAIITAIVTFFQTNPLIVSGLVVAIVDFLIAINPSLAHNGLIELILSFFGKHPDGAVAAVAAIK